jgi:AraC-like DNA-binding protein/quercetin dioxygenase-like cupin family protein
MSRNGHEPGVERRMPHTPGPAVKDAVRALEQSPRLLGTLATDYPKGYVIAPHSHTRDQLLHAEDGTMMVRAENAAWLVPPGLGVWMPAGTLHEVRAITDFRMRTLYVARAAAAAANLPETCRVVGVPPLLHELILRAARMPAVWDPDGPDGRLMAVILDVLGELEATPLHLPMPVDRRLDPVVTALLADPADGRTLEEWAAATGASPRTLARGFLRETGLTFGGWRQRRRLLAALERLAGGEAVTTVALDLGYDSPSAFTAMFRRTLGTTPSRYLRR